MAQAELLALNALSALLFLGKFALPGCTQTLAFRLLQQCLPLKWSTGKRCWPLSTPGGEQIRNAPKTEKRTSQTFSYAASWRCHRSQAAQLTNRQHLPLRNDRLPTMASGWNSLGHEALHMQTSPPLKGERPPGTQHRATTKPQGSQSQPFRCKTFGKTFCCVTHLWRYLHRWVLWDMWFNTDQEI